MTSAACFALIALTSSADSGPNRAVLVSRSLCISVDMCVSELVIKGELYKCVHPGGWPCVIDLLIDKCRTIYLILV